MNQGCGSASRFNADPQIRILLLIKLSCESAPTGQQTLYGSFKPPRLHFERPRLLNFDSNTNPDLALHSNAEPDPASQNNADQDPKPWSAREHKL